MVNWKKPKLVHRVTVHVYDVLDGELVHDVWVEDILDSELSPDEMDNFHSYYGWLGSDYGYDIAKAELVEIWNWSEKKHQHYRKDFYKLWGDGENLTVDYNRP